MVSLLGEVPHRGIDDPGPLGFRSGTRRNLIAIARRRDETAGNSTHQFDLKSRNDTEKYLGIQFQFFSGMR
jgi:hypothetical protein